MVLEKKVMRAIGFAIPALFVTFLSFSLFAPVFSPVDSSAVSGEEPSGEEVLSLRILNESAATEITQLAFSLSQSPMGAVSTKRAVVDVTTSNVGGYKLYVEANGKNSAGEYTTGLVNDDAKVSDEIPTLTETTTKAFWNYVNPLLGTTSVIPMHGVPDKIGERFSVADGVKTNVDITVSVDTTVAVGTYKNQLLFTAIANPNPITYSLVYEANLPAGTTMADLSDLPESETFETTVTTHNFTISNIAPTLRGHEFSNYLGSDDNIYNPGDTVTLDSANPRLVLLANWGADSFPLTVDPNGGIWNDNVAPQTFTQEYGSTRVISNPSTGATYRITYNNNGQGASYIEEPVSVKRGFAQWRLTGAGKFVSGVYTFSDGAGTLTAEYNTASNSFNLPVISRLGSTCKWAEGSASGTQYDGGTARTVNADTTYFAVCVANNYNLTVKPEGGVWEGSASDQTFTQAYNTTKAIPNPSSNPGYTISYDGNGQGASFVGAPTSVFRPFEGWARSGYGDLTGETFTFGAGDGTLTANYGASSNTFVLPEITKEGHTCRWAEGSLTGAQFAGGTSRTIAANTTYFAVCGINQYSLTVEPNGGIWNGSTESQHFFQNYGTTKAVMGPGAGPNYTISYNANGQGASFTGEPTSAQRAFTGWNLSGAGTYENGTYTFGAGDGTLTAQYNNVSNEFTLPTLNKLGHTCKWHAGSSEGETYDSGATGVTISSDTEFFVVCVAKVYTLTVNPNGGKWDGVTTSSTVPRDYGTVLAVADAVEGPVYSISYDMGTTGIAMPTGPTQATRPFGGWSLSRTGGGAAYGSFNTQAKTFTYGAGNDTLTANWNEFSSAFTLPALSKTGYTCKWHAGSATGTEYNGGATGVTITGDATFFAVCTINSYTLTINPNGGKWDGKTTNSTVTQNYNTRYPASGALANAVTGPIYTIAYDMGSTGIVKPTAPASVSKAFSGWTKGGTGTWNSTDKYWTFGAGDGTLTASWSSTSEGFTLPALSKTGHTCKWHAGSATGTEYNGGATGVTITENTTFYAVCSVNSYTLTIRPNGGKWNNTTANTDVVRNYNTRYPDSGALANATNGPTYTISYDMGSTGIVKPTAPASVSKAFDSWTKGGTGTWNSTDKYWTFGAGNGTLTASWSSTSEGFTLPALSKTGHTCKWHAGSTTGTEYNGGATGVTITGNTTFYATCSVNSYNVTVNKGTNIASVSGDGSKNYGSTVTLGATGSAGYHLSGWTVNSGGVTISNNQFTMPANDVVVTANAAINTCSIKYNSNAPSGTTASGTTANSSFNYNTVTATTANGFSVTGYQWSGWAESETGAAVVTTSGGSITAAQATSWCGTHGTTKDLYAKWTKKYTYTLNLNKNDGSSDKTTLNYPTSGGTTDTSHTFSNLNNQAPSRDGYNFLGWATSSTGTSYVTSYTLDSSSAGSTPTSAGFPVTGNLYAIWRVLTLIEICDAASTHSTFTFNNVEYIKLKDGNCYTHSTQGVSVWVNAAKLCPTGTTLPSYSELTNLVSSSVYGTGSGLNNATGWGYGNYWSATKSSSSMAYDLYVDSSSAAVNNNSYGSDRNVLCVVRTPTNTVQMQQMTSNVCAAMSIGTTKTLTDSRDNNSYTVTKLNDSNCWMTQNLRLTGSKELAPTDSNVSATWTLPAQNTGEWCTENSSTCTNTANNRDSGNSSYGAYYSWHAATAGSGSHHSRHYEDVDDSICPRGWKLPGVFAFNNLYSVQGSVLESPANFVLNGYWYGNKSSYQGTYGYYWTSSMGSDDGKAYTGYVVASGYANYQDGGANSGTAVRCIAQ